MQCPITLQCLVIQNPRLPVNNLRPFPNKHLPNVFLIAHLRCRKPHAAPTHPSTSLPRPPEKSAFLTHPKPSHSSSRPKQQVIRDPFVHRLYPSLSLAGSVIPSGSSSNSTLEKKKKKKNDCATTPSIGGDARERAGPRVDNAGRFTLARGEKKRE